MLRYQNIAGNDTRLIALTTLTREEFEALVPPFEACFLEAMQTATIDGLPRQNRRYTTYKNAPLPTIEDKLLFLLVHMKQNLTQEVQGTLFGMRQSVVHKWLQLLRPVLACALGSIETLPGSLATVSIEADTKSATNVPLFTMMALNAPSSGQ